MMAGNHIPAFRSKGTTKLANESDEADKLALIISKDRVGFCPNNRLTHHFGLT